MKVKRFRRIIAAVLFLGVFLLIFQEVNRLVRLKPSSSDRIYCFYQEPKDSLDVLIFGSSHSYYGLQPMELWGDYGVPAYTVGSTNQSLGSSYYLMKDAIKRQHPKLIIVESFLAYCKKKYTTLGMLHRASDSVPFGWNRIQMVNDLMEGHSFDEKLPFYLPIIQYHSRWSQLEEQDYYQTSIHTRGSNIKYDITPASAPALVTKKAKIPKNSRIYADKIIELCKKENVELLFFLTPYARHKTDKDYEKEQAIYNSLEEYVKGKGIPFLNYGNMTEEIGLDFASDLSDESHLNTNGALKVSKHLFSYVMEHYDLKSHKGEKEYGTWDKWYQMYQSNLGR